MNFWEFLSQPVLGTPEEYETFWEGVTKRKQMKQQRVVEEHKHVHFHINSYDEGELLFKLLRNKGE
ncbi:MAG: hypothetical protein ACOCQQ_02000 [Candidatus Nanoarchaeia archaeon]